MGIHNSSGFEFNSLVQDEPSTTEMVMIILNYVTSVPVLLAVGGFR